MSVGFTSLPVISKCFNEVNECPLEDEARRATDGIS